MELATAQDLEQLLAAARERLDSLVRDLRTIDAELDGLATERKKHRLLEDVCSALDELGEIGGARLFWGDVSVFDNEERMRAVRDRVAAFHERMSEIEAGRRALLDEINREQEQAQLLEDDVFEALEEEERRQHEWIVEREIDAIRSLESMATWTQGAEDDRRFRKSLTAALLTSLLFALIVPLIELPLPDAEEPVEVPQRVITMMMEEIPRPRPVEAPEPPPPPPQSAEQKPIEKPVPKRTIKPDAEEPEPAEVPGPEQGILAFREKLDAFKETPLVARLGSNARINNADHTSVSRAERSMLTSNAPGSSGGIQLAALSRNFGNGGRDGGAIQGAALTRASSNISTIGGGDRPLSDGAVLARTDEEIQIVFDRYKSSLYRLYNRELRRDPTLQGQMILRLTIEPDGSVSFCELHATDMDALDLVTQIVGRVRTFDFGAKEVPAITIVYPIDFLPAA